MSEKLPAIKTTREITSTSGHSNTLIGRGLSVIKNQKNDLIVTDLDTQYRQARDAYDRMTESFWYSAKDKFYWSTEQSKVLQSCFTTFLLLANKGYCKAFYPLSIIYKGSQCVTKDKQKAIQYAQLAFDWCFDNQLQEDPEIWSDLGMMYKWSEVVETDTNLTLLWCKKAAEQNNANAQCRLGYIYDIGPEMERNDKEAFFWYQKSAKQGHSYAQYRLAFMYRYGRSVKKNYKKAFYFYQKAAEQGIAGAQHKLGWIYKSHDQGVEEDDEKSVYWFRKSAEQGHVQAQFDLGLMHKDGWYINENNYVNKDNKETVYFWDRFVEPDEKTAVYWFHKAAEQRHVEAQYVLGDMYGNSDGIEQNKKKAEYWYLKAAEQGHADAQYNLGCMYASGLGVKKDNEQAVFWFIKAVSQNYENAQSNLDWLYATIIWNEDYSTSTLIKRFKISYILAESILDFKSKYRNPFEEWNYLLVGQPDDWCIFVAPSGYGFRIKLKELLSKNKIKNMPITIPGSPKALKPVMVHNDSDLLAVVTLKGRMLVFPISELLTIKEHTENALIEIINVDLFSGNDYVVSIMMLPVNMQLKIFSGKRSLSLGVSDIESYTSHHGERGFALPRGFQRNLSLGVGE